jgi:hypothetical protein
MKENKIILQEENKVISELDDVNKESKIQLSNYCSILEKKKAITINFRQDLL